MTGTHVVPCHDVSDHGMSFLHPYLDLCLQETYFFILPSTRGLFQCNNFVCLFVIIITTVTVILDYIYGTFLVTCQEYYRKSDIPSIIDCLMHLIWVSVIYIVNYWQIMYVLFNFFWDEIESHMFKQVPVLKKYPARLSVLTLTIFFGLVQFLIIAAFTENDIDKWKIHSGMELFTILYAVIQFLCIL